MHDRGPGWADGRPDGDASGSEWRTPPRWGIGLTETVNGHTRFLHDGRARGIAEDIPWHGGEAEAARDRFKALDDDSSAAVSGFLASRGTVRRRTSDPWGSWPPRSGASGGPHPKGP